MRRYILHKVFLISIITLFICLSLAPALSWHIQDDDQETSSCKRCSSHNFGFTPLDLSTLDLSTINLIDPLVSTQDLPSIFDWRNVNGGDWTTPIRDQGHCNSCWAFGAMGALEAAINLELNDSTIDMDLSEQYLVSCSQGHGCDSDGWNPYSAWRWLDRYGGALSESCFPYEAWDVPCEEKCEDYEDLLGPLGEMCVARNLTQDEIKQALLDYGPIVAAMAVYNDIQLYRGGVYVHPQQPDESEDDLNHAPVIVGYNDEENCWIMKNSWGASWGEDTYGVTGERGWFRIRYGDCFIGTEIYGVKSDLLRGNDTGKPMVEVQQPRSGWFYLFGSPLREVYFGRTKILGSLLVQADAWDIEVGGEDVTGIHCVEFFVDGISELCDLEPPYEWVLQGNLGVHELRVIAFDGAGNPSNQIIIEFLKVF